MGTAISVISVQFKNEDDNDGVAPPSQHSASGSAELSYDSCTTNAHSPLPKIQSEILLESIIFSLPLLSSYTSFDTCFARD